MFASLLLYVANTIGLVMLAAGVAVIAVVLASVRTRTRLVALTGCGVLLAFMVAGHAEVVAGPVITAPVVVAPANWFTTFWASVEPIVVSVGGSILVGIAAWLGAYAKAHLTAATNAKLGEILQAALENSAGNVVNKIGEDGLTEVLTPNHPAVQAEVVRVEAALPDTLKSLGIPIGNGQIAKMIVGKVGKMLAPAVGAMIPNPALAKIATDMIGGLSAGRT